MAASPTLTTYPRSVIGKANRRLSRQNLIPAVLYGPGRESATLSVNRHDFERLLAHHSAGSTILELEVEGESKPVNVMIREMQTNPIKGQVVHVDFLVIRMDKPVHAMVKVRFVNDPVGVKAGGIMTANLHEINVEAKPKDLPEAFEVDVAGLEVGDTLHVSEIEAPEGVEILDDPEEALVSVQAPRIEIEEEEEEEIMAEEELEPEVIGETPPEEEEEEE